MTGERYGFLDPESLERVGRNLSEQLDYLDKVVRVDRDAVGKAVAEVSERRPGRRRREAIDVPEADVVAVARLFTQLEDRGAYYTGLCPLHEESHHSFAVYPNPGGVGRWVCFHDFRVGNAVSLYAEVKGLSYRSALKDLERMGMISD
ncbi:MAG: CHC2 zinc finger domain-containing protein [Candidatus Shapirobacteria bacterium]